MHTTRISVAALFVLLLLPTDASAQGCLGASTVVYSFDFDSGPGGWTQSGTNGVWAITGARFHSAPAAAFAPDQSTTTTERLYSEQLTLPPGPAVLRFWQWQQIESAPNNPPHACYDGAVVAISTMGGGDTYVRLESEIIQQPYDGPIHTGTGSAIAGENAWCGDPRDWHEVVVDLTEYSGNDIYLRFDLETDTDVGREGWYIDDVVVETCAAIELFADGFEDGNADAWSVVVP